MSRIAQLVAGCFSGGGGGGIINNAKIALVGTSLTQYSSAYLAIAVTLTRDTNGLVSVPKSGHAIYGNQPCYVFNAADTSFEALSTTQYVDANNFNYQTTVTGIPTTTTGGGITTQNRDSYNGIWGWIKSLNNSLITLTGNLGQGGDLANQMGNAITIAANSAADIVVYEPAKNTINTGGTASALMTTVNGHIATLKAAGKKIVVISDTPMNVTYASAPKYAESLAFNASMASTYGSDPSVKFVEVFTGLVDPAYVATTGQALSWVTADGVHWGSRAAKYIADAVNAKLLEFATFDSILPTASGDTTVRNGWQVCYDQTSWDGATAASTAQGCSGLKKPNTIPFCSSALSTAVNSIEAPTSGSTAYWQKAVFTGGASNTDYTLYLPTTAVPSLATLGVTTSDTVCMAVEYEISGAASANMSSGGIYAQSQASGLYGIASSGFIDTGTTKDDGVISGVFITGELQLNASYTGLVINPSFRVATNTGNPLTIRIRRCCLLKKVA